MCFACVCVCVCQEIDACVNNRKNRELYYGKQKVSSVILMLLLLFVTF